MGVGGSPRDTHDTNRGRHCGMTAFSTSSGQLRVSVASAGSACLTVMVGRGVGLVTQWPLYTVKAIRPWWKGMGVPCGDQKLHHRADVSLPGGEDVRGMPTLPSGLEEKEVQLEVTLVSSPKLEFCGKQTTESWLLKSSHE